MKNLVFNLRTAKAQAGCAKLKDTSLSFRRGLGRGFLFTFLLLTLGVGQMWAASITVYIERTGQTYLYIWNSKNQDTSWGGANKTMTLVTGTTNIWKYTVELKDGWGGFNCIFMNAATSSDGAKIGGDQWVTESGWKFNSTANSHETGYTEPSSTFTVTYNGNGKTGGSVPTDGTSYSSGATVTVKGNTGGLVKTGYTFSGWNTKANGTGTNRAVNSTFTITANTTLYAKWTAKSYTVNFDQQSGSGGSSSVSATYGSAMPSITLPERAGYRFDGYYTSTGGGGTKYYNADGSSANNWNLTTTTTLYAKWVQVYRAYFVNTAKWSSCYAYAWSNSGEPRNHDWPGNPMTRDGSKKYNNEDIYYIDLDQQYANIIFNNNNGAQTSDLTFGSTNSGNMFVWNGEGEVKGTWRTYSYDITFEYNGNGNTSGSVPSDGETYHHYNDTYTVQGKNTLAKTGYTFDGWNTASNGSGDPYAKDDDITPTGNVTLYAQWIEIVGGSVTLTAGIGGQVSKDNSSWASSATITGITTNQTVNIYARANEGYSFNTWTRTSGTGSVKTNAASGAYNAIGYANDVVTASFTENMSALSVSRTIDEGSPSIAVPTVAGSATDVGYVTTRTITAAAAATGYALTSWTITNGTRTNGGGATANPITVRSNGDGLAVTVTANYSIQSYTISASNSNVTYSPASGTSFKYGATGKKMTITPKSGYRITNITSNNGAISASADNNAAGSWSVTGTMPAANVTLTVTTAAVPEIRLLGRFKIYNSTRTVYTTVNGSNDDWEEDYSDSHLSMTYNYVTGYYDLATYRSASELTADDAPYFFLKSSSTKYGTSSGGNTDLGSSVPVSANVYSSGGGGNFHFNSDAALINVVLHFDKENYKFWFTGEAETLYSTTFYAGDHGSINAKGTSISKNSSKSVTIGLGKALTATPESGYLFDYWETTGSVTVADIYSASTTVTATAAGGTVRAHYSAVVNSGWYVHGQIDDYGQWGPDKKERPIDRSYRGVSGVYYRRISKLNNDAYFGVHDGTNKYSGHTKTDVDYNVSSLNTLITLYTNSEKSFQAKADFAGKWLVVNTNGTKKMWIQDTDAYYTMSVTSDHGTVTLTENVYGNLKTNQFEAGETVNISVSAASGYWIDDIELNGTPLVTDRNSGSWSGSTTMPAGNATLTVTYNRYYTLTYDANYYTSGTGGTAPSASSYVSGSNVTVVGKGDLTMTNYTFSGWNTDPHITGTNYAEGANIEMTGNITLYGVWKRTIPFELEDADPEFVMATVYGTYNCTTLTDYDNPTKDGYTFGGWWTNIAGGNNYVISPEKELQPGVYHWTNYDNKTNEFMRYPTSKSSLYAKWTQTVTLNPNLANHGSGDNTSATIVYKATGKTSITHCTPAAGYHLVGYYTAATDGVKVLNADGSFARSSVTDYITDGKWTKAGATTLYAHYEGNTYTVTLAPNGGSGSNQTVTATYDAAMPPTLSGGGAIVAPSKTGYAFGGYWYESTQYYAANLSSVTNWNRTSATTLNAKWTPKQSALTFDYQTSAEGYGASGSIAAVSATYGAAMPALTGNMPTAAQGYAFMGFYSETGGNGTLYYNPDKTSAHNWDVDTESTTTLYAYYKKSEITAVVLNHDIFEPVAEATGDDNKDYVFANPTIAPRPTPTTKLCWELRYSNDNPVAGDDYRAILVSGDQVKFKLVGLAAGGYKIHVELRTGSECGAGTLLSSYDKSFSIASKHIVTIQYKCGDFTLKAPTSVGGKPLDWSEEITADAIDGYAFSSWTAGDGVTIKDAAGEDKTTSTYSTIQIKANYDGTLTANYTKKRMIYFNNTLGWESVYVYFYRNNKYWGYGSDAGKGTGSSTEWTKDATYPFIKSGAMTQIDGTDIWFYDCEANSVDANVENIVFTEYHQENYTYFSYKYGTTTKNNVICRGDYKTSLPMFVPLTGVDPVEMNNKQANYYNEGYWMNYPENTGYTLKIYNSKTYGTLDELQSIPFEFTADKTLPMSLTVELNANKEYGFEIHRADGTTYGNDTKVMKINDSGDNADAWAITSGKRTGVKTSVAGDYIFTLNFGNNGGYNYLVGVHYPVAKGDYRILYQDLTTWSQSSAHTSSWSHPSRAIHKEDGAEDIVSFYVSKATGANATMKFQYASAVSVEGVVTWTDVSSGSIDLSGISASGVYNFYLTQSAGAISVDKIEAYTGKFYIRTDCAGSTKWENYRASDHEMPYTEFSMSDANSFGEKYSHYYTHWCPGGTNIKFVVANEYSSCISDTLESDLHDWGNLNDGGWLKHQAGKSETQDIYSANVRFMYNQETNKISRAYVASSTEASRLFLVLRGNEVIKDENGTAVSDQGVTNGAILSDKENWIYERILQIKPDSRFKLFACYAEASPTQSGAQYFRGAYDSDQFTTNDNSVILISGTGDHQKARILYDFKTNRLICAWLPSDATITEELNIDADVMVIRDHQEAAECITFSGDGELKKVKTVYGAMKFNRWTLNNRYRGKGGVEDNNKDHCATSAAIAEYHGILPAGEQKSVYERSLYFISFPFDVKVSEIFGFGTYGKHWVLEYYDGLNRAKNGYWIDSPANWKYVTPSMAKTYELKAYEGYILCLSLGRMAYDNTEVWPNNISNVELYFPSKTPMTNIQTTNVTIPGLSDEYRCTINREGEDGDRRVKDSYWRCLGVPSYNIYAGQLKDGEGGDDINWQTDYSTFPFLYAWNMTDNTLTPQATNAFSFKPMHAYLTQIGTAIYWKNVSATPASVIARQVEEPAEYNWRLTLNNGEDLIDQTYVRMSTDEVITNEFDFGQDLAKELNAGRSDIYSFIGYERAAANSMQMNTETTTIVPLGLNIEATGEYTFSIPDGTNGIGITLIDEETGIRTSLSALDYTVELAAGDYTERFWLEISPVKGAETGIDPGVDARENGVRKVMIDGILYIVRDGKMYDATGKRVE